MEAFQTKIVEEFFMDIKVFMRNAGNEKLGIGIVMADEYVSAEEATAGQGGNDVESIIVDAFPGTY